MNMNIMNKWMKKKNCKELFWTHCDFDLHHDLKTNIIGLRLPAAAGSLKPRPQDSFRIRYAKNTSPFVQALIAQLVERAGLVQRTGVRFPSLAIIFFMKVED